jgi:hypothetical protein
MTFLGSSSARRFKVFVWTLVTVVALDSGLGIVFRMPTNPRQEPTTMQRYLNYGRSVESKLRALVGPNDDQSGLIALAGWIDTDCRRTVTPTLGTIGVSIFGNSFSNQLADQLANEQNLSVARYAGPGAPPNHSYACFIKETDSGGDHQPVQIIGVTSSSLPRMQTIWGATTSFEYPQPFTFPRYRIGPGGELAAHEPSVRSVADLRRILSDEVAWKAWLAELKSEDYFYSRSLIDSDVADLSVVGRMIRRGLGQSISHERSDGLRGGDGTFVAPGILKVLPVLISDFASRVRRAGKQPIVVLFEEQGSGGMLGKILGRTLTDERIDFVDSTNVAPSGDYRNFAPDGHFTKEVNQRLAKAVLKLIQNARESQTPR